jgi:hypothetical protein
MYEAMNELNIPEKLSRLVKMITSNIEPDQTSVEVLSTFHNIQRCLTVRHTSITSF